MTPTFPAPTAVSEDLITRNLGLARQTAWRFHRRTGQPYDDLEAVAFVGLIRGCRRYDPSATGFVPVFVNDWCGDHRLDENRVAERYGRGIADAQRTDAMRHELELEAARKERDHYLSACEELQRDNESLSRALDRMTDKAASLAGIKP